MRRRLTVLMIAFGLLVVALPLPGQAIIHELVASHCAGHQGAHGNVDPPGQLNENGNSFARALQASGIYEFQFGVDQEGVPGLIFSEDPNEEPTFGPMPGPDGTTPLTIVVDNTRPNAKLGEDFVWGFFPFGELSIYIQLYDLDHPAFDNCPNI